MLKSFVFLVLFNLILCSSLDGDFFPANLFQLLKFKQKLDKNLHLLKPSDIDNFKNLLTHSLRSFDQRNNDFNISSSCADHMSNFSQGLINGEDWAIKILDSLGKPSAGIANGAINWLGDYRQCLNESITIYPRKYCYVTNTKIPFKYGICVPKSCSYQDLYSIMYFALELLPLQLGDDALTYLVCQDPKELDWKAILALSIVGIIALYVIIATLFDLFVTYNTSKNSKNKTRPENKIELKEEKELKKEIPADQKKSKLHQILIDSSIYSNTIKLFDVSESKEQLNCLNGIRFFSLSWVILGHSFSFLAQVADNLTYYQELMKRFPFMIVINGIFSVDSFFLLSGLLTSYLFVKITSKTKLSFKFMIKYYVHRYLRITPVYMIVLMISATLSKYSGSGPIFPKDGFEFEQCKNTWYLNLLYVNNLVKGDKQCLGVSWYLANDMQFHLIAPLILIPFALKKPIIGVIISILILVANIIASAVIISQNPGFELGTLGNPNFFTDAYIVPWFRIGPYIVGLLLGYIIYLKKTSKNPKYINPKINIFLWIFSLFLLCLIVFGNYPNFKGNTMKKWINITYESTAKIIWSIGLSYVIFASVTGNGGVVNRILSWKMWKPLAKISFSVYLIHSFVLTQVITTELRPIFIQDTMMAYRFLGNVSLSLIAGYLVHIFFELPWAALEKHIFK